MPIRGTNKDTKALNAKAFGARSACFYLHIMSNKKCKSPYANDKNQVNTAEIGSAKAIAIWLMSHKRTCCHCSVTSSAMMLHC